MVRVNNARQGRKPSNAILMDRARRAVKAKKAYIAMVNWGKDKEPKQHEIEAWGAELSSRFTVEFNPETQEFS